LKKNSTIGCCGIDCGLCPRFYTKGDSVCPGCGGLNFKDKHPSCGYLTCCAIKNRFEVCSYCKDYPCDKFDSERKGFDSFVTHRKVFDNLNDIKTAGIAKFIDQQKIRMGLLQNLLNIFDDGRSKSFFCISCALLPLDKLQTAYIEIANNTETEIKDKSSQIKAEFKAIAENLGITLQLNNKIINR
jgi:hypothetical protein